MPARVVIAGREIGITNSTHFSKRSLSQMPHVSDEMLVSADIYLKLLTHAHDSDEAARVAIVASLREIGDDRGLAAQNLCYRRYQFQQAHLFLYTAAY